MEVKAAFVDVVQERGQKNLPARVTRNRQTLEKHGLLLALEVDLYVDLILEALRPSCLECPLHLTVRRKMSKAYLRRVAG